MHNLGEELATPFRDISQPTLTGGRDTTHAAMFAGTLAWAVKNGIPLPDALRTLPFYNEWAPKTAGKWPWLMRFVWKNLPPEVRAVNPLRTLVSTRWSWGLNLLIADIEKGLPLGQSVETWLGHHLPSFYIAGLKRAEEEGRLETAAPILAEQITLPAMITAERRVAMIYVYTKIFVAINVMLFLAIKILPKFAEIFYSMAGEGSLEVQRLYTMLDVLLSNLGLFVFSGIAVVVIYKSGRIGEWLVLHTPVFGREKKLILLTDMATGMAAFMRQGDDIVTAARWGQQASKSYWISGCLKRFADAVDGGGDWITEWRRMNLGIPLVDWLVVNSAAREDPASGLELTGEWLYHEVLATSKRIDAWLDPVITLIMAAFVGYLSYLIFSILSALTTRIMDAPWP